MVSQGPIMLMVTSQDWGGAQAYVFNLAKSLKNRGLTVIVCAGGQGELANKCHEADIDFIDLKWMVRGINPINNLLSLFELTRLFRRLRPSAIHLNSTMMGVIGSLASRLTHVPRTIYVAHGWVFNEKIPTWKKSLYILIEKISSHWKDVIICINPAEEDQAKSLNFKPRDKFITIPNGIDVEEFESRLMDHNAALNSLTIQYSTFSAADIPFGSEPQGRRQRSGYSTLVGTIANAYPAKNLLNYLDVCALVHVKNPTIQFVIIGDGPQMDELKRKHTTLKQESYVHLMGRRMDAPKLYRAFDIFVLPSTKEGMSITILETMAARVPCIATDVGANRLMLEDAGIIVPPNDNEALAEAILKLSDDGNLRTSLASKAYEQVKMHFSWERVVTEVLEVIKPNSL